MGFTFRLLAYIVIVISGLILLPRQGLLAMALAFTEAVTQPGRPAAHITAGNAATLLTVDLLQVSRCVRIEEPEASWC